MDFKRKLKIRFITYVTYIVLGVIMIAAALISKTENYFISSFGFALVAIGVARMRRHLFITKSEENIRKREIIESDERNVELSTKARATAFSISILALGVAVIVLSFMNMSEIAKYLSYGVVCPVVIYWISYLVYSKKN